MILTIIVVLFCLVLLTALHELGHFVLAKKFGVKVEEFGIGYPPRLFGKKIGQTIYSLNLLPFGAFVKITGEDGGNKSPHSFSQKPIWQRALVLLAGVLMFWLVAFLIFTFVAGLFGVPTAVDDSAVIPNASVQVLAVSTGSPADQVGIKTGDQILELKNQEGQVEKITKTSEVQEFAQKNKGQEIEVALQRENKDFSVSLTPRENPPQGEGAIGIALVRVAELETAWYKAPVVGFQITYRQTKAIPVVLCQTIAAKIRGEKVSGVQFMGPIGVGQMLGSALGQGLGSFLVLIALISVWLALFNLLPIPALDGGRLLFLGIEAVRRKPMNQKTEQKINTAFFLLLILLMVFVTAKDLLRLL